MSEIKGEWIKCPNCGHEFDSHDTFEWLADEDGHPTMEHLHCERCAVATEPIFQCNWCPSQVKCKLDEECGATLSYPYNEWIAVEKK